MSMPPLRVRFQGRADIIRFMAERMFATQWRLVPTAANGQLAFACYQQQVAGAPFRLSALTVIRLRGDCIAELIAFLDPEDHAPFELRTELVDEQFGRHR